MAAFRWSPLSRCRPYLIVAGAGDIGTPLVALATETGNEVVVIERDEERAERASRQYHCLVINDDATAKETTQDADADRAASRPSVADFRPTGEETAVFEIGVGPDAPIAGKTLRGADEAALTDGQIVSPSSETV